MDSVIQRGTPGRKKRETGEKDEINRGERKQRKNKVETEEKKGRNKGKEERKKREKRREAEQKRLHEGKIMGGNEEIQGRNIKET